MKSSQRIQEIGNAVISMLLEKNKAYGDSALNPANIFAKGTAIDNLCSRIDDKLMRIKNKGISDKTEDTINDLIGYLILLKIAIENETLYLNQNENERSREKRHDIPRHKGYNQSVLSEYWTSTGTHTPREEQKSS